MSDDDPFYSPKFKTTPRVPKPGELLFEFIGGHDRRVRFPRLTTIFRRKAGLSAAG
jgi:hypothetical protein